MSLWFRVYTDLPNCVKLRKLSADDQIGYIWCLCLHKEGHLVGQPMKDVAWALRMSEADTDAMIDRLAAANLLMPDRTPTGWSERQFESDGSTPRVRKFRAKQAGNGGMKRFRNVSETADETDQSRAEQSRAETEQSESRAEARAPIDSLELVSADSETAIGWYVAAYHAIPGLGNSTPDAAILNALKAEPDGGHRARAWNEFAAAAMGSVEPPKSGIAMLAAYMRNARKHKPANEPRNVMEG